MWRRKNEVYIRYAFSKDEAALLFPTPAESPVEGVRYTQVYIFKSAEKAKKLMSLKNFFAKVPLATRQTIPMEKFTEACLKAASLAKESSAGGEKAD